MGGDGLDSRATGSGDLASCVALCLLTLGEHAPGCAEHLGHALARLLRVSRSSRPRLLESLPAEPAVEPFLSFLLPEIDAASPLAGAAVRRAIQILRQAEPASGNAAYRPLLH